MRRCLFQIAVKLHLAGIEPAAKPDNGKDENLLEEEGGQHLQKIQLRERLFGENVNDCHCSLNQEKKSIERNRGKRMSQSKD